MINNEPLVSVITICFNAESTIENSIKSVIDQSYKNIEYIIIDGNSTDSTCNIIDKYLKYVDVFISESDYGIFDAFNKGIENANGEFIQFLNSDDILDVNKVQTCINYMLNNQNIDVLNGNLRMFSTNAEEYYEIITGNNPNFWNNFHMGGLLHPTFFVRANIYRNLKFRSFKIGTDFDWVLRALNSGVTFKKISDNIVYMKDDGISNLNIFHSMLENYKISIVNNRSGLIAIIFLTFVALKKIIFKVFNSFLSKKVIYLFKPHKKFRKLD